MLKNIIYDKNDNQVIFYKNDEDGILYVKVADAIKLQVVRSYQEHLASYILFEPTASCNIDVDTATAIIAYIWNERKENVLIEGYANLEPSNISLSYHIVLGAGLSVFDVAIGGNLVASYSINLSSSDIRLQELREQGNISICTHIHTFDESRYIKNTENSPARRVASAASDDSAISVDNVLAPKSLRFIGNKSPDFMGQDYDPVSDPMEIGDPVNSTDEELFDIMDFLSGEFKNAGTIATQIEEDESQYPQYLLGLSHDTNLPASE